MPYKPVDEKTVGLYLEGPTLQAAYVSSRKGKISVSRLIELHLTEKEGGFVKPLYIDVDEKEIKKLADTYLTVTGLSSADVLVRRLSLKLTKEKDIEEAFIFQVEPLLPYPLESAIVDKLIAEKQEVSTLISFLTAKKESIQKHLSTWQELGIDPEVISAESIALNALVAQLSLPAPVQFVVHISRDATLCTLLRHGKLFSAHRIEKGWYSLYQALINDREKEPPSVAELFATDFTTLEHLPHLKTAYEALLQAIHWNLLAQQKETKTKEMPALILVGAGANLPHLSSFLAAHLGLSQGSLIIPEGCSLAELNTFALPIGLALTCQPEYGSSINFRRQELAYATPWKRFRKPLLIYAGLCALLSICFYLFGMSYIQHREDGLKARYLTLLSLIQKPYDTFEKQYETKYPSVNRGEGILPIDALDTEALNARLDYLQKEIRAIPDTFPLLPNTPRVSDVLAWLNTHPTLCSETTKENGECPSFSIDTFSYSMVKRPELNKKNEKYQVKIDLEFETSSSRLARELHDALISPNEFVDPKSEIKWNATKGKYRTSFYLKDKTIYPSPLKDL